MTAPGKDSPAPLAAEEGVNEGSAASTQETAGAGSAQTTGAPHAPDLESAPAPPDDMESSESRAARDAAGTGQQLQAGEG